jgi:hypothetical protein
MKIGLEQHEKNLMEKYERPLSVKNDLTAHASQCFEGNMKGAGPCYFFSRGTDNQTHFLCSVSIEIGFEQPMQGRLSENSFCVPRKMT